MTKPMYQVEILDEEMGTWHPVGLEMCSTIRNCGCAERGELDICDNSFDDTDDLSIAKTKFDGLVSQGNKARIIVKTIRMTILKEG